MSRELPLKLQSSPVAADEVPQCFESDAEPGIIRVRGHLSTGSRGWRLHAAAACRRSVIVMHVTAVELPPGSTPDLEYHSYDATIRVHRRGRFHLKVRHGFRCVGLTGVTLPDPVYEATLAVP
jgi:hypothetical protein